MTLRADFPEKGGKLGECTTKQPMDHQQLLLVTDDLGNQELDSNETILGDDN